jgi:hypothetical protein
MNNFMSYSLTPTQFKSLLPKTKREARKKLREIAAIAREIEKDLKKFVPRP